MGRIHSQTSTEYLVIVAVVVVIALIVISVLGGIPGIGGGVSEKTARAALSSAKVAITNYAISDYDTILQVRNNMPNTIQVDSILIDGEECVQLDPFNLRSGDSRTITCMNVYDIDSDKASFVIEIGYTDLVGRAEYLQSGEDLVLVGSVSEKYESILDNHVSYSFAQKGCWNATSNPHPICTCYDLNKTKTQLAWNYALQNSIDFDRCMEKFGNAGWTSGEGWMPIGSCIGSCDDGTGDTSFIGLFDGGNYIIQNLYINAPTKNTRALFGNLYRPFVGTGDVSNLGVVNADVTGSNITGAIAGYAYGNANFDNCFATGNVTGTDYVGGLVAFGNSNTISSSYFEGTVQGNSQVGGIIGYTCGGSTLTNVHSGGTVSGNNYIGGLVGYDSCSITIRASHSTGSVSGINRIGGLGGYLYGSTLDNVYNTGLVTCSGTHSCGGLVGSDPYITIDNAYWTNHTGDTANACIGRTGSLGGTNTGCTVR